MLLKYITFGAISGFFSSTPLGPINLWVADHQLAKSPLRQLVSFLVAVILIDMLFAGAALWGHFTILQEDAELRWTGIITGLLTALLGVVLFIRASSQRPAKTAHRFANASSFLQGLILTALNPAFVVFWIFVANMMIAKVDQQLAGMELATFLTGVMLGDVLWFLCFTWILAHVQKRSQASTLTRIRQVVGGVFIVIGLAGMGSYVF
jgi:threonine/homoserine/homoserine lactone efflux protein